MSNADIVFQSYGRSCNQPEFYHTFYSIFMNKSSDIRAKFEHTNMQKQYGMLRGGILWLIMHARGMGDSKIKALGQSHCQANLNIHPALYDYWLDALMETISKHDPEYSFELEQTWRTTLAPSIDMIKSMYHCNKAQQSAAL